MKLPGPLPKAYFLAACCLLMPPHFVRALPRLLLDIKTSAITSTPGPADHGNEHAELHRPLLSFGELVDTTGLEHSFVAATGAAQVHSKADGGPSLGALPAAAGLIPGGQSRLMRHTGTVKAADDDKHAGESSLMKHFRDVRSSHHEDHLPSLLEESARTSSGTPSIVVVSDLKIRRFGHACDDLPTEPEAAPHQGSELRSQAEEMPQSAAFFQLSSSSEAESSPAAGSSSNKTGILLTTVDAPAVPEVGANFAGSSSSALVSEIHGSTGTRHDGDDMEVEAAPHEPQDVQQESALEEDVAPSAKVPEVETAPDLLAMPPEADDSRLVARTADAIDGDSEPSASEIALLSWIGNRSTDNGLVGASGEGEDTSSAGYNSTAINDDSKMSKQDVSLLSNNASASPIVIDGAGPDSSVLVESSNDAAVAAGSSVKLSANSSRARIVEADDVAASGQAEEESWLPLQPPLQPPNVQEGMIEALEGRGRRPVDASTKLGHSRLTLASSFRVMMCISCLGIVLWACCLWLWYTHSALRAHVEALPVCLSEEVERRFPMAGGYDCAISKPVSSGHPVRLEGRVCAKPGVRTLISPLAKQESVLYSAVVTRHLHDGMQPVPVAFASASVDFMVVLAGNPQVSVSLRGEDVSLFDMVAGKCVEKRTFISAPEAWQDFVLCHRTSAPSGEWQTSASLRAECRPIEFQEYALHIGAHVTIVGELHRGADGTLSLQSWQVAADRRAIYDLATENARGESWRTSWEQGGLSPSRTLPWAGLGPQPEMRTRKVLVSDDPQLLCSKATGAGFRQRFLSCCMAWDVRESAF